MEIQLKEVEVQKLNLEPNDFLVVTIKSDEVDSNILDNFRKSFAERLNGVKVVLFGISPSDNIDLSVIKQQKTVPVKIKKLHENAVVPKYAHEGDSGFDLVAIEDVEIAAGETKLVKTGLAFSVGEGFELQVRPRSGMSLKTPLRVANAPGTVDSSFSGEVCVIMSNTLPTTTDMAIPVIRKNPPFVIKKGDRIAQGVICPVVRAEFEVVEELEETSRNTGAFGSTGV